MKYLRFDEKNQPSDISHHGILGMRWGVRNAETRARYARGKGDPRIASDRDYKKLMKTAQRQEHKGLTDGQKTALKVAVGTAAVVAVGAVSIKLATSGLAKSAAARKMVAGGFVTKAKEMSPAQDLAAVNRGYLLGPGYRNNCVLCSTAYDLRRRGYDVAAGATTRGFNSNLFFGEYYRKADGSLPDMGTVVSKATQGARERITSEVFAEYVNKYGPNMNQVTREKMRTDIARRLSREAGIRVGGTTIRPSAEEVKSALLAQGEGARGHIAVQWPLAGGHSIAYEVRGGKVHFPDGQINREHNLEKLLKQTAPGQGIEFVRLDNAEPDLAKLAADGRIRDTVIAAAVKPYMKK